MILYGSDFFYTKSSESEGNPSEGMYGHLPILINNRAPCLMHFCFRWVCFRQTSSDWHSGRGLGQYGVSRPRGAADKLWKQLKLYYFVV